MSDDHSCLAKLLDQLRPERGVWINGEGSDASTGRRFAVEDPATGSPFTEMADGDVDDALQAAAAAAAAFPSWSTRPPRERSEILRRTYELMIRDLDDLAYLLSWENGKPQNEARAEIAYAAEFFRWYAEEAVRSEGSYGPSPSSGARILVTQRAAGVALLVTPWNLPAAMVTRKVAPALAAGCTVVLKPAAETPLVALAIARILHESGAPAGVVNVVPTTDPVNVVAALLDHSAVRTLSFTGSTPVGRALLRQAANRVVTPSMELGGNAPFVVTADADVSAAVDGAMVAKFRNSGQACTAANRFLVHERVHDEFVARFTVAVESLEVAEPFAPGAQIGPVISNQAQVRLRATVESALEAGATRTTSDRTLPRGGWFVAPTVLVDVAPDAAISQDELFGPVAPVIRYDDRSDLIAILNAPDVGLAAYVYAGRAQDALRIAESLEVGMVGINRGLISEPAAPFGGVKQSGLGREGGREGMREFQETQYFSLDWPDN